jgi:cytosine/adenosine deaminase-related metal-dependent hydrolase
MNDVPIRNGAVVVRGERVVAVGPAADLLARYPSAACEDLGDVVLLPGLVNPHVHLELTHVPRPPVDGKNPSASFVDWLLGVMAAAPPSGEAGAAAVAAATRAGVAQCLRFGVTTVGDITRHPAVTRGVLAESPLRAVSFGEVTAMGARRHLLEPRLAAALAASPNPARIVSAVSPHAPYSIELDGYKRCLAAAKAAEVPVATHLAESPDEAAFLSDHSGRFRRLWDVIGGWDERVPKAPLSPPLGAFGWAFADSLLHDGPRVTLVHVNYLSDVEMSMLSVAAQSEGLLSVVYCPRTHAYFGHPPHRWREMLDNRVNVAVGTDSAASSADLNLVDDLRLLRQLAPDVPPTELWAMATTRAARALGMEQQVGAIAPHRLADMVAFPIGSAGNDPLAEILDGGVTPAAVWIGGLRVG